MLKMKRRIFEKWLEALRSGEYQQGTGLLRSEDDKYCCLGVLCDVAEKEGVVKGELKDSPEYMGLKSDPRYYYGAEHHILPIEVIEWAGMADSQSTLEKIQAGVFGEGSEGVLTWINDISGANFDRIAEVIENNTEFVDWSE